MAMNWAEAKARWTALGYNQAEFSRKLQSVFTDVQGLSPSRLSRKAASAQAVEPRIEEWISSLPPRPGRAGRTSDPLPPLQATPSPTDGPADPGDEDVDLSSPE